jgi:hypothetical protein
MLEWIKRRGRSAGEQREPNAERAKPSVRAMSGKYLLLHRYLRDRYATTVVLTFAEIEDVLGFALPHRARLEREWWTDGRTTDADTNYADSWILASRTATPNLLAGTVAFEREP